MKKLFKKLILVALPFLTIGCSGVNSSVPTSKQLESSVPAQESKEEQQSSKEEQQSSKESGTSGAAHTHNWANEWSSDANNHWKACDGCNEKGQNAAHTFGEWQTANLGELVNDARFSLDTVKYQDCSVCGYRKIDSTTAVLPEIRFTFDKNDPNANFATAARSTDKTRPTVPGTITITNAGEYNTEEGKELAVDAFKVRGNQTAGFDKKGFQIKFNKKQNLLGLNGGPKDKGFKKWVLLADAKDTTVSRTALGLTMCDGVVADDSNVWYSKFTPVSVYLNDQYWGLYMLAEQKEVKDGRIKLDEPINEVKNPETGEKEEVPILTNDIGYNFELDYYAKNEADKGADGDPTFEINYGDYFKSSDYKIESCLANSGLGLVKTYTMNSDINDSTAGENEHLSYKAGSSSTKSNQLKYIADRLQALFNVLGEAVKNKKAKDIDENNNVISTTMNVRQAIEKHFDLNAWAEGFIINGVCLPPDVGYSSFYLSFNNTAEGDHRLRYDVPWDFDSNFGNRRAFLEKPDEVNTSNNGWGGGQSYDPYFMDRTANMWLQLLGKLDFFMSDYVIPKWKAARQNKVFENMFSLVDTYYQYFEGEYAKNFAKWTTTQSSDPNVSSYFNGDGVNSGELRKPFVDVKERKAAQQETINWLTKRVAYLDSKWK